MNQQNSTGGPSDGRELGASFEAHTSHNPGSSFIAHTSSPPDPHRFDGDTPRRSHTWRWVWIGLAVVLIILVVYHFTRTAAPAKSAGAPAGGGKTAGNGRGQQGPAAITVDQSKTGNINIYVDALGTVTPTNTVTLYSQITGRVMDVHYREGQIVRKGDPLVEIDPRPYQATLTQAQGTLQHDEAVLAEARIDLARYQAAFAKNAIARQQLEDQEQTVKQDEGTVKADQGTVAYDEVQLAYCHIVAPISGRVGLRLVDPGNTVFSGSSSTLVVITQLQPITVVFNVSEDNLPQIQSQLHGRKPLNVDAFDRSNDKQLDSGKLGSFNNQIDTTTGTVKFRADFANQTLQLFPNQFVNARLLVSTLQNTTLIPSAAVQHNGTASFVYVVKPGANNQSTVAVQPITVVTNDDKSTAVQGIGPGVTLATSGFDRLENGVPVLVRNQNGSPNGANKGQGKGNTTSGNTAP
jgi:multidrug efflux system membrane fusion protein